MYDGHGEVAYDFETKMKTDFEVRVLWGKESTRADGRIVL